MNEIKGGYPTQIKQIGSNLFMSVNTDNDTCKIDNVNLIASDPVDFIISKLDTMGTLIDAKRYGGNKNQYATYFETDIANNIYLCGLYNDSIQFGTFQLQSLNPNGDILFVKIDSSLNPKWIKQSNSTGSFGAKANSIIKIRRQKGGKFKTLEEIKESHLISEETYERIINYLMIE